jgi:hypothetical protein
MKRLELITEFDKYYKDSDLQKIVNNNPLPIKYTINGFECYFYNADLFGLFDWNITKDGITTNDFINHYKDGFIKGLGHLKKIEKIKIKHIKDDNKRNNTILQIQNILFEREFQFGSKGLINLVFKKIPLIFTEKNIYDWGYWNGIIHSIEILYNITGLNKNDLEILPPQQPEEKFKTQNLFKVGLLFATGKMNKYFTVNKNYEIVLNDRLSPFKIAKELGNPSFEKWILASKNNYPSDNKNGNKNIFNNLDMMNKIIAHCKAEKIEIDTYFISRLPIE